MKNRIKFTALILSGIFALICLLASCSGSANPDTPSDGKTYYKVTFDSDGGSSVATQKVESGQTATKPDAPTKTDYDFEGWFLGDTLYDFNTPVEANIKLKAKWEIATYTITFDSDGGSDVEEKYVTAGKTVEEPDAPGKQGYGFYGWYNGETEYDFSSAVHSDLTLKAKWGPVKAKEVTNENIVKTIKTLTESKTLKATGEFSHELIREVNKALKALYEEKPAVLVSLDLSEVTGLSSNNYYPITMELESANPYNSDTHNNSFYGCKNLESIILPDRLYQIGSCAFEECSNLTSITIPENMAYISSPFGYSPDKNYKLTNIYYKGTLQQWCSIDYYGSFPEHENFYLKGEKLPSELTIPNDITSISNYAFSGCSSLTSVSIPNTVTKIGEGTFSGCTSLTSVNIPDSVTEIGGSAFSDCSSLKSITIPDSVTEIEWNTFSECSSLTSVNIPDSVTKIGGSAFSGCSSLTSITIPDSVTEIGSSAFEKCSSLTSITLPDSVTKIGESVFQNCTSLEEISIPFVGNSKDTSNIAKGYDYFGILFGKSYNTASLTYITDCNKSYVPSSLKKVTITGGEITKYSFDGCVYITDITISGSVTKIGSSAFSGCLSLKSINISANVKEIESYAFSGCLSLKSINIPATVKEIGSYAFKDCSALSSVTFEKKDGWKHQYSYNSAYLVPENTFDTPENAAEYIKSQISDRYFQEDE